MQSRCSRPPVGELSEPIKAPSAYHVVRLEERRPERTRTFEEVRDSIMSDLQKRYVAEQRELRIKAIHADPELCQPAGDQCAGEPHRSRADETAGARAIPDAGTPVIPRVAARA